MYHQSITAFYRRGDLVRVKGELALVVCGQVETIQDPETKAYTRSFREMVVGIWIEGPTVQEPIPVGASFVVNASEVESVALRGSNRGQLVGQWSPHAQEAEGRYLRTRTGHSPVAIASAIDVDILVASPDCPWNVRAARSTDTRSTDNPPA
jgi:hypothetical protein